jgi:hypothetical protein
MAKFRTTIKHKEGSSIELYGLEIALNPDESGFCEFDVPDERDDVIERLKAIPEGFALAGAETKAAEQPAEDVVIQDFDGNEINLTKMDLDGLKDLAEQMGLKVHHKAKAETVRGQIVEFVKG